MSTNLINKLGYYALILGAAWLSLHGEARGEPPQVIGMIRQKWNALGGAGGFLHQPVSNEQPTFDGTGRWQQFQGGIISWHPTTGAFSTHGLICELWLRLGREKFGYPITDETATPNGRGRFNHFRAVHLADKAEASIYWTKETGAHEVHGAIRQKWAQLGWERSKLRFPKSDERADGPTGRRVDFEGGHILWSPKKGAREVITATTIDPGTNLIPADE